MQLVCLPGGQSESAVSILQTGNQLDRDEEAIEAAEEVHGSCKATWTRQQSVD
jgi:hypothetical protein